MRAVRYHGRGDIRVDQIDEPMCGDGEVKIRPAFVGICGSDIGEYVGGPRTVPTQPHAVTGATLPVTLGHEFSGTVEAVGTGVSRVKVGDRVAIKPNLYDGSCASCLVGRVNSCQNLGFIGYSSNAGGLSDYVVVKEKHAIQLPDSIPLDIAALIEPLAVAWHAVKRSPIQNANNETVLIVGGGPIGLAVIQVLKRLGLKTIVVTEVSQQRQAFAKALGATQVLNPKTDDVVAKVRSMTNDAGANIAFECSGIQAGLDSAVAGIRARGTVTIVSLWEEKPLIDAFDLCRMRSM
ncbi:Dehydrogenase [Aspergillus sclerotialis]|uniref:Dehydrogenase n=1 Tax=Aspergillus sclerotialis TaxID=2070753 RepID=A0A3A2ZQ62_9EURO|nr:Dehydrogenase [Aspergillus sclerotialis]